MGCTGQTLASTGSSSNPYMFKGAWGYRNDSDAGLSHVGARYYDAQVGRFITRDTYLDQHPYLYCEHNPINAVDRKGHRPTWITQVIDFNTPGTSGAWGWGLGIVAVGSTASNVGYIIGPSRPGSIQDGIGLISAIGAIGSGAGLIAGGLIAASPIGAGIAIGVGVVVVGSGVIAGGKALWNLGRDLIGRFW